MVNRVRGYRTVEAASVELGLAEITIYRAIAAGHKAREDSAVGRMVQLAFGDGDGGDDAVVAVQERMRPFQEALKQPASRPVPLHALHDICALGYEGIGDLRAEPPTKIKEVCARLTSVLVRAGTVEVIANWDKVRRAQANGQETIEVVDEACDGDGIWWALLAEIREIKQRDWARRLYVAFRHLPPAVVASLTLREWESVLGVDYTSVCWLIRPLPADLAAQVVAGELSIWAAYQQAPKSFWVDASAEDGPDGDIDSSVQEPGDESLYDSPATLQDHIQRAGLAEYVRVARCLRSPQAFNAAARTYVASLDHHDRAQRRAPRPRGAWNQETGVE